MAANNRLLVITELFMPTKGGTAVWFDEVYRRLGGKAIHIVTAQVPGADEHDRQHPNSVHRLELRRSRWLRPESLAMYIKLFFKCFAILLSNRVDSVHAGRVLPEGLVGWCVARMFRKPLVIYAHGEEITTWRQSGKFKAMVFAYTHADTVIANSEFTREELLKIGVAEQKIVLIYPGVDIDRFKPGLPTEDLRHQITDNPDSQLVLSVGRLTRRKGFDQVIRVLPSLTEGGIDLHYAIIGTGGDEGYLQQLAIENNNESRVHFLGHVEVEDLPRWYNAADLFVMANREIDGDTEGFGMVFMEAAACGTPSIAGLAGGTGAAVLHEKTGLRIDGDDSVAIANAIKKMLTNPELIRQYGDQGLTRARSQYSWTAVAAHTQALLDDLRYRSS